MAGGFGKMLAVVTALETRTIAATTAVKELGAATKMSKGLSTITTHADDAGGGMSLAEASKLVDRYNELLILEKESRNVFDKNLIQDSIRKTADYFQRVFGAEFGSIQNLAKERRTADDAAKKQVDENRKQQQGDAEKITKALVSVHAMVAALPKHIGAIVDAAAAKTAAVVRSSLNDGALPSQRISTRDGPPVPPPPRGNSTGTLP